jgi:hypothetical protein
LNAHSAAKAATISRGRKGIQIFTCDKEQLRENITRSGDRPLALNKAGNKLICETDQLMNIISKLLLAASVIGITGGSILDLDRFNINPAWAIVLPLGAVSFGLFMIYHMLEEEVLKFNADSAEKSKLPKFSVAS